MSLNGFSSFHLFWNFRFFSNLLEEEILEAGNLLECLESVYLCELGMIVEFGVVIRLRFYLLNLSFNPFVLIQILCLSLGFNPFGRVRSRKKSWSFFG